MNNMLMKIIQIKNQYISTLESNLANALVQLDESNSKIKELTDITKKVEDKEAVQVLEDEGGLPNQ